MAPEDALQVDGGKSSHSQLRNTEVTAMTCLVS